MRAVYAERREDGVGRELRRGFTLAPGERVLVVDDVMTTGGSLQETIAAISGAGGTVAGAAVLVDERDLDRAQELYASFFGDDTSPLTGPALEQDFEESD